MFNLTKCYSNDPEIVQAFRNDKVITTVDSNGIISSVSGLSWKDTDDLLLISRGLVEQKLNKPTPRQVLAVVSSIYDPLDQTAPFMIRARLLLEEFWLSTGQQWDKPVNAEEAAKFSIWLKKLPDVFLENHNLLKIFQLLPVELEIHAFADASLDAICPVVYLRAVDSEGLVHIAFFVGESRVAPIRKISLPKSELQSALIAV